MLVNFTDQGLKGVKDVPNRQDKSRETGAGPFLYKTQPSNSTAGEVLSITALAAGRNP
jgi:hypothetical protein